MGRLEMQRDGRMRRTRPSFGIQRAPSVISRLTFRLRKAPLISQSRTGLCLVPMNPSALEPTTPTIKPSTVDPLIVNAESRA